MMFDKIFFQFCMIFADFVLYTILRQMLFVLNSIKIIIIIIIIVLYI